MSYLIYSVGESLVSTKQKASCHHISHEGDFYASLKQPDCSLQVFQTNLSDSIIFSLLSIKYILEYTYSQIIIFFFKSARVNQLFFFFKLWIWSHDSLLTGSTDGVLSCGTTLHRNLWNDPPACPATCDFVLCLSCFSLPEKHNYISVCTERILSLIKYTKKAIHYTNIHISSQQKNYFPHS